MRQIGTLFAINPTARLYVDTSTRFVHIYGSSLNTLLCRNTCLIYLGIDSSATNCVSVYIPAYGVCRIVGSTLLACCHEIAAPAIDVSDP